MLNHLLIAALAAVTGVTAAAGPAREKVILDTDFTTSGDDGMVGIMAAQLHAQGVIPLTNVALAIRMNPEIVPLIKRIVYMGGAFEIPGNTTPAAEMNIWYDPEAARIVVREPIDQAFIPLDVTDTVPMNKALFEQIAVNPASVTTRILKQSDFARALARDPLATSYIYDTLALAYLVDASYATDVVELWVDVDVNWGPSYGRTLGFGERPPANLLQKAKVVRRFDNQRFCKLYVDLMTRPVPVRQRK